MVSERNNRIQSDKRVTMSNFVLLSYFILSLLWIPAEAVCQEAQSGYNLIGTIQSGDLTGAVIAVSKSEQTFFRKFEKLPDGSQIIQVLPESIVLKRADGTKYEMFTLHETKTVASVQSPAPANTYTPKVQPPNPDPLNVTPSERFSPKSVGKRRRLSGQGAE